MDDAQLERAADILRDMLAQVDRGDLVLTRSLQRRLDRTVVVAESVLGEPIRPPASTAEQAAESAS